MTMIVNIELALTFQPKMTAETINSGFPCHDASCSYTMHALHAVLVIGDKLDYDLQPLFSSGGVLLSCLFFR